MNSVRRRWTAAAVALTAMLGGAVVGTAAPMAAPTASAAPSSFHDGTQWYAGDGKFNGSLSSPSVYFDGFVNVFVYRAGAQWQGAPSTPSLVPTVGQTFYVHIWTELANAFDASYQMRVLMPTGLQLVAPTAQDDLYCEVSNLADVEVRFLGPSECNVPVMSGLYAVFPTVAMNINEKLHFWFPVKATQPMNQAEMQVLSDQSLNPIVSLPDPVLTSIWISAVSAPSVPSAPSSLAATPGNGNASISFATPPNGGSAITNYQYSVNNGAWTALSPVDTTSPVTIPGLVNGVTYGVRLRAVNSIGAGTASGSVSVTPRTTPSAPTGLTATGANGQVSISFTAGANGGSGVTNHEYSLDNGAWTALSPADATSPVTIPGLANGTSYSVRLRSVNAAGAGTASAAVAATPVGTPAAPTGLTATALHNAASIGFTAGSNGGLALTNYQYSIDGGAWTALSPADTTSPVRISGLSDGVPASVRLRAVNSAGAGTPSFPVTVTPTATAPAAPTALAAAPRNGSTSIAFAPGSNNGAAITNYEYSVNSGAWTPLSPADASSPILVKGLVNGTRYGIRLRAVNSIGAGAASASVSVVPAAVVPAAPATLVASPRNGAGLIAFVPGDNGGSAIRNYQYSVNGGAWRSLSPADHSSPVNVPGLTNGVVYSVRLRAVNGKGAGAASAAVNVRPSSVVSVPAPPKRVNVTPGLGTATVSFVAGSDGGAPISNYLYSLNGSPWKALSPADARSPITIPALANTTTYSLRLKAKNSKGASLPTTAVSFTTKGAPLAPTGLAITSQLFLDPFSFFFTYHGVAVWAAPANDGGSPITGYTVRWWSQEVGGTVVHSCTTTGALTCASNGVIPLLVNYWVDVTATNATGEGQPSARVLYHL